MRLHTEAVRTPKESALKVYTGRKKHSYPLTGIEPGTVLRLAFLSDTLPAELSRPSYARLTKLVGDIGLVVLLFLSEN